MSWACNYNPSPPDVGCIYIYIFIDIYISYGVSGLGFQIISNFKSCICTRSLRLKRLSKKARDTAGLLAGMPDQKACAQHSDTIRYTYNILHWARLRTRM